MKKIIFILSITAVVNMHAQCCYTDSYSSSVGWTMNGSSYSIGPNTFSFSATPCDASSSNAFSYATHPLPCILSDTTWKGDIDFEYTGRGTSVSHTLLGVTAGAQNAWNTASFGSSNQDAVAAYINGPNNSAQSTDSIFGGAKLGTVWNTSSKGIPLSMNVQYYIRLERVSLIQGKISLFTDAARTIHAPGSPQTFPINSTVTGLNVVQHGSIPQGYYTRTLTGTLDNLNICDNAVQQPSSTCCYTDSYSSSTGWIMNGLNYSIGPNTFSFSATPCDASSSNAFSYATRSLPCTLSDTAWKGDIDFEYTGRGTSVSHTLLGVTAGAQNAWNTASFGSSNQDAVAAYINGPNNSAQSTDSIFGGAKLGTVWNTSSKGIPLSMNVQYYIRLERVSLIQGKISLFTDAARTIHAPGSPQTFPINSTVTGLNVVQHGSIPQGYYTRTLTGTLDNLNICNNVTNISTGITKSKAENVLVNIYPNPNNGNFIIETNSTVKQTLQVYDINGSLVLSQILNGKCNIDASSLNNGVYNLSITSDWGVINKKILIMR